MSKYNKLYTPEDSAVVFIDHQPQMTFGVASIDLHQEVVALRQKDRPLRRRHEIKANDSTNYTASR